MNSQRLDIEEEEVEELDELYEWIDKFTLSRPKRNIAKDFSDGILVGEIVKELFPKLVDLRSLVPSLNTNTKKGNWETLNSNCFFSKSLRNICNYEQF